MKIIYASKGQEIFVDDDLYDELNKFKWFVDSRGYARRKKRVNENFRTSHIAMHHIVAGFEGDYYTIVDHKNRNKLDNQKHNLQVTSRTVNKINSKVQANSTTGYKGVYYRSRSNKYEVKIGVGIKGKRLYLGSYSTADEAALVYNNKAIEVYGEDAVLNKIGE